MNSPKELILYQFIFLLLTVAIVLKGISGGIEKASRIMMPALLIEPAPIIFTAGIKYVLIVI